MEQTLSDEYFMKEITLKLEFEPTVNLVLYDNSIPHTTDRLWCRIRTIQPTFNNNEYTEG